MIRIRSTKKVAQARHRSRRALRETMCHDLCGIGEFNANPQCPIHGTPKGRPASHRRG